MPEAASSPPLQRSRRIVLALLGLSVALGVAGNVLLPLLLSTSPALLLVVQASYAQMGLASPRLDPVTFVAIASLRRFAGEVVMFAGGRVLGPEVLRWVRGRTDRDLAVPAALGARRSLLRDAAVVLLPHPLLGALFGMAGMPAGRYVVLKLLGSVATVMAFRLVADAAAAPLGAAGEVLDANVAVLTVLGVIAAAVWAWRRGRSSREDDASR